MLDNSDTELFPVQQALPYVSPYENKSSHLSTLNHLIEYLYSNSTMPDRLQDDRSYHNLSYKSKRRPQMLKLLGIPNKDWFDVWICPQVNLRISETSR